MIDERIEFRRAGQFVEAPPKLLPSGLRQIRARRRDIERRQNGQPDCFAVLARGVYLGVVCVDAVPMRRVMTRDTLVRSALWLGGIPQNVENVAHRPIYR